MTILVTGGGGYIGSHMVWTLLDKGEDVLVIDNLITGFSWAVAPEAELIIGDIGDTDLVLSLIKEHKVEGIIHFAGSVVVPESVENPLKYYLNNTMNSRALIETAVKGGVQHFIFSSTAAVYGTPEQVPVNEDAPLGPESPYGTSKWMTEMMLRDVSAAHPLNHGILRYFNVAGADQQGRTGQSTVGATHLIKVACEAALGKRTHLNVFGTDFDTPDGTGVRDYIHVSDLADAHYGLLQKLRGGLKCITANCGYGAGYSVLDVINVVKQVSGVDFEVKLEGRRAGDVASVVAANERITTLLDWKPQHNDLHHIVETALKWEDSLAKRNNKGST